MGKKGVTIKAAAEILSVSIATLRNWDKTGVMKARRSKKNGYRLYDIGDLEKYAETHHLKRNVSRRVTFVP